MQNIIIIDCGSQFTQLIARRLRELKIHSVVFSWDVEPEKIIALNPNGIIISGGPDSVNDPDSIMINPEILEIPCPILGICYGMQLIAKLSGGEISSDNNKEYGVTEIQITHGALFNSVPEKINVLMSHGDNVSKLPDGFRITALTSGNVTAGFENAEKKFYGLQFHPEVNSTQYGTDILKNFLFKICLCSGDWDLENFTESTIRHIQEITAGEKIICGLSGGVDSSVAAALVNKAVGNRLQCVFVDHGLMRLNEPESVMKSYENMGLNVKYVNASELFLNALAGVNDPEKKRHIIGK